MSRHKVGIIGCGWFVHFYLKALPSLDERVELKWVADPSIERALAVGDLMGVRSLADYREGLEEVDVVFVLVPHHLHHEITLECLRAGCHVLIEKPIALNLVEADEMIAVAEASRLTLMVAYPHRYRGSMQHFRDLILGGQYGGLIMLDGLMDESLQGYSLGWISKKETLGGGVFFSSSPHMLDVMFWIAGSPKSLSMVGVRGGLAMEGEDTACSVIKFENGAIGVTRHTWVSPASRVWYTMHAICENAHITLTTTPVGDLVVEGATCKWKTKIIVTTGSEERVVLDSDEGLEIEPEVTHFLDCIESGENPQTDGAMGREMIEVIGRAYAKALLDGSNV